MFVHDFAIGVQMEDELYNCLMSEINGNHLYQKQAYETLTDINQLRQMETLPRWDDKEKLLWQSTVAIKSDSVGSALCRAFVFVV